METKKDPNNWLYPDLFTTDELLDILKKRYVKHTNINSLSKDELVDLYNQYVLPLPQRKHRLNRRGREMTKKQVLRAKKRKSTTITAPGPDDGQPSEKRKWVGRDLNSVSTSSSSSGDRLKPPPSCINFEKKTVKLNSGSNSQSDSPISKTLVKLKINHIGHNLEKKVKDESSEIKKIKLKVNTEDTKKSPGVSVLVDKIIEKTNDKSEPMDTSSESKDEVTKPKKIKINRIAWP